MFDLVIIGGGLIGATASYLARQAKPKWRILVLERSLIAKGASAYSAGLDFPYGRTPRQKQLSIVSGKIYAAIKEKIPVLPIQSLPFVGVVKRENLDQVLERFTAREVHTAGASEREALLEAVPDFTITDDQELLVSSFGAIGFVDQIASLLVAHVCSSPEGECWEGVAITKIRPLPDHGYELEAMDGRRILARRVLIATGPWLLNGPGAEIAKDEGVRIKKVAALHVHCCPPPEAPILYFFDEDAFLLPVSARRRWIFSFTSQEWNCVPDSGTLYIRPEERNSALSILGRYYSALVPYCCGGRVFCDAYSQDWAPIVKSDPTTRDLVVAGACSGAGFRIAPAIARDALRLFSDLKEVELA